MAQTLDRRQTDRRIPPVNFLLDGIFYKGRLHGLPFLFCKVFGLSVFAMCAALMLVALYEPNKAFATGGAFPSTKHGGNTTDGDAPCGNGVNRGKQGPAVDGYGASCASLTQYYTPAANTNAGVYASGECAHCHEAHASFGTSAAALNEPPPAAPAGPTAYLAMEGNYNSATQGADSTLCWYCHNNMTISPSITVGNGKFDFYQGQTNYTASSHGTSVNFKYPGIQTGDTAAGTEPWPRRSRSTLNAANTTSCLNCHTPHGISGSANYPNDAVAPASANYGVSASAAGLIPRQLIAWEEALCLRCHDGDGPATAGGTFGAGKSVKDEADNYVATQGSGHPMRNSSYLGLHNLAGRDGSASTTADNETSTATAGWLGTSAAQLPHAECVDCHNPHRAQGYGTGDVTTRGVVFQQSGAAFNTNRGGTDTTSNAVNIGKANIGVWGVTVTTSTGAVSGTIPNLAFTTPAPTNYMYQLCFKCHSAWAWMTTPTPGTASPWNAPSTTKAWTTAGVPANKVMTDVAYEFSIPAAGEKAYHPVFGAGQNAPAAGANSYWSATAGASSGNCGHRADLSNTNDLIANTLNQTFVPPWRYNSYITCTDCHEGDNESSARGPHGSARPFILRNLNTAITYNIYNNDAGTTTQAISYATPPDGGTISTDQYDFCINCHRLDVYNYRGSKTRPMTVTSSAGKACYGSTTATIQTNRFSRQPHPPDSGANSFDAITITNTRNGMPCMICHGGRMDKLGVIHGDSTLVTTRVTGGKQSARFIAVNGTTNHEWGSLIKGSTTAFGSCTKGSTLPAGANNCGNTQDGNFVTSATYNY